MQEINADELWVNNKTQNTYRVLSTDVYDSEDQRNLVAYQRADSNAPRTIHVRPPALFLIKFTKFAKSF